MGSIRVNRAFCDLLATAATHVVNVPVKAIGRKPGKSVKAIERHRQSMVHKPGCASAMEVLQKAQVCPLHTCSPLSCTKDSCPEGRYISVK